eukprot:TRINITY_DN2712_c0_g1_i4.p1 TRINITY_DN2712_c0_g1~~TRINITY_DN2712_c0_g1_i4.p1  ORF type:complete len:257 (+),score=78.09 TRINITY_DN2712_c0_g1_i4:166-936(+)
MHTAKTIKNFTETELSKSVPLEASWHMDYKDSAYIFVGGLNYELNEGDIAIIFSQYGEISDVLLQRDKKTGKSKGFAFIAYEDQRSTVLAVDNFNGAEVCGRSIRVDHVRKFRPPKEYTEIGEDEDLKDKKVYKPSGPDGRGWDEFREYTEEELKALEEETRLMKQKENRREQQLDEMNEMKRQMIIDADERWEKLLMKQQVEEENKELLELRKKIKKLKKMNKKSKKKKKEKKEKKHKKDKEKEMSEMPQQSTPY